MSLNDLISVIVPVYNMEKYIKRCVDSIIEQTYSNIEIILVDDGSTDICGSICDEYALQDKRIIVLHKKNGGLSDARNCGLEIANGKYISFIDSDDWVDIDFLEKLYACLQSTFSDIAICGIIRVFEEYFDFLNFYFEERTFSSRDAIKELIKNDEITTHPWNKLYKRELLSGIKFPVGKNYEDVYIIHKIFAKADQIVVIPDWKYYYFQRSNSIIYTKTFKNEMDKFEGFYSRYCDLIGSYHDMESHLFKLPIQIATDIEHLDFPIDKNNQRYKSMLEFIRKASKNKAAYLYLREKLRFELRFYYLKFVFKIIKRIIPPKFKHQLHYWVLKLKNRNGCKSINYSSNAPCYFLIGTPEYENLGDHAIAYAEIEFLKSYNLQVIEITEKEFWNSKNQLMRKIRAQDIICLQGGGNMGSQYQDQDLIREWVIKHFHNKIVLFPQTIYFDNSVGSVTKRDAMQKIYSSNKRLILTARESASFELMKKIFPNNKVILVPDIVFSMNIQKVLMGKAERRGALMCLRSDVESSLGINDYIKIKNILIKYSYNIRRTETKLNASIDSSTRNEAVFAKLKEFTSAELVITDRLHGMIFCTITGTPCIVFGNYNHKLESSYNWIKDIGYIHFCENIDTLENLIDNIKKKKNTTHNYNPLMFAKQYETLIKKICS